MSDYDQLYEQALTLMDGGERLDTAYDLLAQALALLPEEEVEERALVQLNMALCLAELGRGGQAVATAWEPVEAGRLELGCDIGMQLLQLVMEQCRGVGDLGKARVAGERALAALEGEEQTCSHHALLGLAQERAALARDMGQPDDAEETLATALEILADELEDRELDADTRFELLHCKARLLETRAHNRFEGHADEIAVLDLEDAVKIHRETLGDEHEETRRLQELLAQVSGNY